MQEKTITITISEQGNAAIDLEGFEGPGCEKAFEDFRGGDRVTMERKKPAYYTNQQPEQKKSQR